MNKDDFEVCLFSGKIKALDKDDFLNFGISQASLNEKAKGLLPEDFDPSQNVDVMPVVFNLAVVNEFNKNGDGIDTDTAIAAVKRFVNKPINIEHQKHKIVGHMINASFSEDEFDFKENDIESYAGRTEPFYITAAGFIYSSIFPELAEAVSEAAKQEKEEYQSISTSWELAFSEYKIAKGSKKLSESIVLGGEAEMANKKYIKGFGGEGEDETGTPVNRLIVGQTYPLGAGITLNPAARVRGIYLSDTPEESNNNQAKERTNEKEKNSLNYINTVNKEKLKRFNNMSKEEFEKVMEEVTQNVASIVKKDDHAKSIGEVMRDALTAHSDNWKSKIELEKEARSQAEANLETLTSSFDEVQKELNDLKSQVEAKAAVDLFNERMNYIDDTFSLTEKELEFVVAEMKALDHTDESFESLKEKLSVIFSHKSKESIAATEKAIEDKVEEIVASRLNSTDNGEQAPEISEASGEDLEIKDEETATLPNNSAEASSKTTLLDKLKETFTVEITK